MHFKIHLSRMAVVLLLVISASGCAAPPLEQPQTTSYMKHTVGTPDELSPQAPGEAKNVRKVGNHWICDLNGQVMVYDEGTARWEPQQK